MDLTLSHERAVALTAVINAEADGLAVVRDDGMISNSDADTYWFPLSSFNLEIPQNLRPGRRERRDRGLPDRGLPR